MDRTAALGHDSNRYTEGNPSSGTPATIVSALAMNLHQEELVNVVLDAGIALSSTTENQVVAAIKAIVARGGTQTSQAIADNQAAASNIAGLLFAKATIKSAKVMFDIIRRDDTQSAVEFGEMFIYHDTEADIWRMNTVTQGDDAEVTFAISTAGQVSYQSLNYGGAGYSGTLRFTNILTIAQ